MKKTFLPVLIVLTILISACNAAAKTEATAEVPTAESTVAAESSAEQPANPPALTSDAEPCVPFSIISQTLTTPYPGLPEVTDADYIVGRKDAPITFMVYSEPQCPYCAQFDPYVDSFPTLFPNDVRFVYRLRPFSPDFHDKSILASQAMVAAGKQGKFDEFRSWIYQHQNKALNDPAVADLPESEFWVDVAPDDLDEWLAERVSKLGIDPDQFVEDMFSDAVVKEVEEAKASADAIGINGTPTLFINGYPWPENQRSNEIFSIYTKLLLNQDKEFDTCPAMEIDSAKSYTATIATTKGDIVVDLFADKAPYAVNSFVFLAKNGWYKNLPIISTDQFVLSGDPTDTGYGGPGYVYKDEIDSSLNYDEPGMLSVFGVGAGLNGGTFFINRVAMSGQEGRTIFGKVTSGLDVVDEILIRDDIFVPALDKVLNITITEK